MHNPQPMERSPSGKKELEDLSGCPDSAFSSCPQDPTKKDVCGRSPASLHLEGSPGSTTPLRKRKLPVPRCLQSSCCSPTLHQYRPRLGGALFGTGTSAIQQTGWPTFCPSVHARARVALPHPTSPASPTVFRDLNPLKPYELGRLRTPVQHSHEWSSLV